ncbi:MAG: AAA family ATPase [Thermoproteota archaeon]|nr:AAA family ATPase [Thermoproteota archaeon]
MNEEEAKRKIKDDQERERKREQQPKSVLQVKRIHEGPACVLGVIVSVSEMYVVEQTYSGSMIYRDAKSIQLEDIQKPEDNERLDVILYDHMINSVMAGEVVEIAGTIVIENKKENRKSKKKVNVLHAESIKYINRKELVIRPEDTIAFEKFAKLPNTVGRLISMVAPNVYGHDAAKLGILRSIVGGIEKNGRRGRINTLLVGDPGTAKSKLGRESVDTKPNSRYVTAQNTSGKSLTAIIDREGDTLVLRLGPVALARNAICVINEITAMSPDDQKMMLDVLEEGKFTKGAYGVFRDISAPTTIIATANPIQHSWNDKKTISNDEIWMVKPLLERFDQIYSFRDNFEEQQCKEYTDFHDMLIERRLHNHNFLRKYLIHASKLQVTISDDAKCMLNAFWIKAKSEGKANNRMLDSLFRIAEAQAKLQLKNEVDDKIAKETIESFQVMMVQYGEFVQAIVSPKKEAYEIFLQILMRTKSPISLEEICQRACQESKQVAAYLGSNWLTKRNHRLRSVVDMLLNHKRIRRTQERPIVLLWLSDISDVVSDESVKNETGSNIETNNINHQPVSLTSLTSLNKGKTELGTFLRCPYPRCTFENTHQEDIDIHIRLTHN